MLNVKVNYLLIKNFFLSILLQVNGTYPIDREWCQTLNCELETQYLFAQSNF